MTTLARERKTTYQPVPPIQGLWIILATAAGVLIAWQPMPTSAVIIGLTVFIISSLISPLAPIAAMMVIAPIRTLFATESGIALPLDFGQLLLASALMFWVIHRIVLRQQLPHIRWSPVLTALTIFTTAAALSAFSAVSFGAWLTEWLKWGQMIALVTLCLDLAARRQWEWLVFAAAAAGVTNAALGVYQFFGGSGALHLLISTDSDNFRAFGTFGQPNPFGAFMGLLAPLMAAAALGYFLRVCNTWRASRLILTGHLVASVFYAAAFALISAALILSWSRGAWLGFGISIIVTLVALPRRILHGLGILILVTALGGIVWASGRLPASITDRIASATQETFSFTDVRGVDVTPFNYALVERLAHWQAALNMAADRPFLGVGLGNYEVAYPAYRLMNWDLPLGHAHNFYLNVLGETGIIGLLSYGVFWCIVISITWRITRKHPDTLARITAAGLLGTWVYVALHSLTDNLYVNNLFLELGVLLGILAILHGHISNQVQFMRIAWGSPTASSISE